MREIRQSGSEGGGAGKSTGPPYPYYACAPSGQVAQGAQAGTLLRRNQPLCRDKVLGGTGETGKH